MGARGVTVGAIVLAGGRARRLGGADKAQVVVDGRPLVEHVLASVASCTPVVVVGPPTLARPGVRVVRESPPFVGPAAAAHAALPLLGDADETWLLACDLPRASALVQRLGEVPIPEGADGVVAVDVSGRMQWLAGRYRVSALQAAAARLENPGGASMRALLGDLRLHRVDAGGAALDLDTWEAIEDYRRHRAEEPTMTDTPADLDVWVRHLADALGVDATTVPTGAILDVTRDAAHGVTRPAGPVTTFLLGVAVARGMSFDEAARIVRATIAEWPSS